MSISTKMLQGRGSGMLGREKSQQGSEQTPHAHPHQYPGGYVRSGGVGGSAHAAGRSHQENTGDVEQICIPEFPPVLVSA